MGISNGGRLGATSRCRGMHGGISNGVCDMEENSSSHLGWN